MPQHPQYTPEFKEQAVRLSLMEDCSVDQVARDLGISPGSLVSWRRKAGVAGSRRSGRDDRRELDELRRRNQQLEKEKRAVEMERDILKKATAFFAKQQA